MLYLGFDQHARQITISLRDEDGDVIQARQVSTRPEKINELFLQLTRETLSINKHVHRSERNILPPFVM